MEQEVRYLGWCGGTIIGHEVGRVQHSAYGELVLVVTTAGETRRFTSDRWRRASKRGRTAAMERQSAIESQHMYSGGKINTKRKALEEEC